MEVNTRQIAEFIETRQYKKALRSADTTLKKHPNNPETLCLKGLALRYLGKKDEAYDLVSLAFKNPSGQKNYVCWHVYGLIHRHDRDYPESIRCYREALKQEPNNLQILRDLALLQVHTRDLEGAKETRKMLLTSRGNNINLMASAVAEHLSGNITQALTLLDDSPIDVQKYKEKKLPIPIRLHEKELSTIELSEVLLYKASLLEEAGEWKKLLLFLHDREKQIVDKLQLKEIRARIFMLCGVKSEAFKLYKELYERNPENHIYILCLMACEDKFVEFWPALPPPTLRYGLPKNEEEEESLEESTNNKTGSGEEKNQDGDSLSDETSTKDSTSPNDCKENIEGGESSQKSQSDETSTTTVASTTDKESDSSKVATTGTVVAGTSAATSSSSSTSAEDSFEKSIISSLPPFSSLKFGEVVPSANVQSVGTSIHPASVPVWGWLATASESSESSSSSKYLQKATYKRIGKRIVKQKKPFIQPVCELSHDKQKELLEFMGELRDLKKSESAERISLCFLTGDLFIEKLKKFLRPRLQKGLPSIFRLLKPLYYSGKCYWEWIGKTIDDVLSSLESRLAFDETEEVDSAGPTSLLFCLQLAAEHNNMLGEYEKAISLLDRSIEFAPTNPELYLLKARVLKSSGDLINAAFWYEEARKLDLADRYLNTRSVKGWLRIDDVKRAQPTMIVFSRDNTAEQNKEEEEEEEGDNGSGNKTANTSSAADRKTGKIGEVTAATVAKPTTVAVSAAATDSVTTESKSETTTTSKGAIIIDDVPVVNPLVVNYEKPPGGDPPSPPKGQESASNSHDMQAIWYESEVGRSFFRQKLFGRAIRYFQSTVGHFNDISADQFDFHNYCVRKFGIQTYISMLRMQDVLYSHKSYRRAVKDLLKIYCLLLDDKRRGQPLTGSQSGLGPGAVNADSSGAAAAEVDPSTLSAAEKKKLKHAAKRQKAKAEVAKEAEKELIKNTVLPCTIVKSEDPNGTELLAKLDIVEEGTKLVQNLLKYAGGDAHTYSGAYNLYSRQSSKSLLCAKQLEKCYNLEERLSSNAIETLTPFYKKHIAPLENDAYVSQHSSIIGSDSKSGPHINLYLRESVPCIIDFVFRYLPANADSDLKIEAFSKEIFKILSKLAKISESSKSDSSDSKTITSVAEAKKLYETCLIKPLDEGGKFIKTIKEHHGRLKCLALYKGKEWCDKTLKGLEIDASFGPYEHFQKFYRFLVLELLPDSLVSTEAIESFVEKCKKLFKTELKLEQNHI